MKTKASSKTVVSFKVNLFLLLKTPFEPVFFFVDYSRGWNNLIPTAFLLFDVKDEGINSLRYFARLFFVWKYENGKGVTKLRKNSWVTLFDTLREVIPKCRLSVIRFFPYMDTVVSDLYGHNRIRFCPYTEKYRSEKAHISGYFTHCENKELYKIFDTNSKVVIPYKWLIHSILRICTIQRLSQFKVA